MTEEYVRRGIREDLVGVILKKKLALILIAKTADEVERAANPHRPQYDFGTSVSYTHLIKKDVINNAAYELIVALTAKSAPPRKFELSIPQWDDLMIANIVENAINAIDERIGY